MRATLENSGDVGHDLLAVDWAATPLGPLETWPRSLRTVVRMLLASRFSMCQQEVQLEADSSAVLYTDGLVERRGEDLELGVHALAQLTSRLDGPAAGLPERLVQALLPDGPDDDVAVLIARVDPPEGADTLIEQFEPTESAVITARHLVADHLTERSVPRTLVEDAVLATSELLTNAIVHGLGQVDLRLRTNGREVLLEVQDQATYLPRKMRPTVEDEHGRGLQIVAAIADRWGVRATDDGKSVWCVLSSGPQA